FLRERREQHQRLLRARKIKDNVAACQETRVVEAGLPEAHTPLVRKGAREKASGLVVATSTALLNHAGGSFSGRPVGASVYLIVLGIVANHSAAERGVGARIGGGAFDPQAEHFLLVRCALDAVMRPVEHGQKFAGGTAEGTRVVIALRLVAAIGEEARDGEHIITVAVERAAVTGEEEASGAGAPARGLLVGVAVGANG